ncbi:gephyrin-like molybdotransferase Glp [Paenibacillus mesotrionivorans]|uniref:Gephyrin-like molybdotransferase Glp n=1 Tax=Paenibacillus mesotrionivorans TaxID=3160968 RepID=A0ACC7NZN5_9BACL
MKFQRTALQVEEAAARILERLQPGRTETVPLAEAWNRYLAEPLAADQPVPHFRRSGMDGYALRAEETAGASEDSPVRLAVTGIIPCGSIYDRRLEPGQAVRIMTGAAVPDGADAVVRLEDTLPEEEGEGGAVSILRSAKTGANISEIGLEIVQGEKLLEPGRRIGPGEAALLAMFGAAQVKVYARPRVAVFATGSELLAVEEPLAPGKIRNSNSYMLLAQLREAGCEPVLAGAIPDELELARQAVTAAMDDYDMVITTGGVSVGDYDILYDLTTGWDGELLFNKLAMRPGSPTTASIRRGKLLFALSGNPAACFVGFELLVRPALRKLMGGVDVGLGAFPARLKADRLKTDAKFTRFVRGVRTVGPEGQLWAAPVGVDASSITVSLRDADCLIVVPPGDAPLVQETLVRVIPLGGSRL